MTASGRKRKSAALRLNSEKRLNSRLRAAKDQRVNVVRALVGVDQFDVVLNDISGSIFFWSAG